MPRPVNEGRLIPELEHLLEDSEFEDWKHLADYVGMPKTTGYGKLWNGSGLLDTLRYLATAEALTDKPEESIRVLFEQAMHSKQLSEKRREELRHAFANYNRIKRKKDRSRR